MEEPAILGQPWKIELFSEKLVVESPFFRYEFELSKSLTAKDAQIIDLAYHLATQCVKNSEKIRKSDN